MAKSYSLSLLCKDSAPSLLQVLLQVSSTIAWGKGSVDQNAAPTRSVLPPLTHSTPALLICWLLGSPFSDGEQKLTCLIPKHPDQKPTDTQPSAGNTNMKFLTWMVQDRYILTSSRNLLQSGLLEGRAILEVNKSWA